jgi:hypothetical protein
MMNRLTHRDREALEGELTQRRGKFAGTSALFTVGGAGFGRSVMGGLTEAMGGDADTMREVRAEEGGLNSLLGGGTMERAARGLGMMNNTGAEASRNYKARADSIRNTSAALNKGLFASATEQTDAESRLAKSLGSDGHKASRLVSSFEEKLAAKAQAKKHLVGGSGALNDKDRQEALNEAAAAQGITNVSGISLDDLTTAGAKGAKDRAGSGAEDSFRMPSMEGSGATSRQQTKDELLSEQTRGVDALFGAETMFETKSGRRDALSNLYGSDSDPRVITLSLLQEAAHANPNDPDAQRKLSEFEDTLNKTGEKAGLSERARAIRAGASDSDKALYARGGKKLGRMPADKMVDAVGSGQKYDLALKDKTQRINGLGKMHKDSSLLDIESKGGTRALMTALGQDKQRSQLSGKEASIVDRYKNAKTDAEREAAMGDYESLESHSGSASEKQTRGGLMGMVDHALGIQEKREGEQASDLADTFPDAVKGLEESTRNLNEAAVSLGAIADRLHLEGTQH